MHTATAVCYSEALSGPYQDIALKARQENAAFQPFPGIVPRLEHGLGRNFWELAQEIHRMAQEVFSRSHWEILVHETYDETWAK